MMKYLLIDKSELIWKYNLFITTGVNALPLILSWDHFLVTLNEWVWI